MNIAFFGTSDRSVPILENLKDTKKIKLCITKSDRVVGRKKEIKATGVKNWAIENKINYIEIDSLKDADFYRVMDALKENKIDTGVVADFSYMIPLELIDYFNGKIINIHFSLLPKYRGASPVQHAILNGDETTGITFQILEARMDAGDILFQIGYTLNKTETSGELYGTMFEIAAKKLPELMEDFEKGDYELRRQNESEASFTASKSHPRNTYIYKEDALIDWSDSAEHIERQVRAYNPWPISWTYLKDLDGNKKIFGEKGEKPKLREGVNGDKILKIYKATLKDEKIEPVIVKLEGKSLMTWEEFKNGYLE